jgi:hypothetical protein
MPVWAALARVYGSAAWRKPAIRRFIIGCCLAGTLVLNHPLAQSGTPSAEQRGFDNRNIPRATAMLFEITQYAMAFPANPSGKPFLSTLNLPNHAHVKLLRLDGTSAVMTVIGSDHNGQTIWIDPGAVKNAAGWTLAQVLSGVDQNKTTTSNGLMAGGPFFMRGNDMIACKREDAVEALSAPDAESRFGRHSFLLLFQQYGCVDVPDGAQVEVRAAGETVAMILPHAPVSSVYFVLRKNVVDTENNPIPIFNPQQ